MNSLVINKQQGFTQIPNCVLNNPMIKQNAKLVYGSLISCRFNGSNIFPGHDRIAWRLNISVSSVKRALNELKGLGLITWKQQGLNKPNLYFIEEIPARIKNMYFDTELQWKTRKRLTGEQKTESDKQMVNDWESMGYL